MPTQAKAAVIDEITERFQQSSAAVLTEYRGLTVAQLTQLRRSLGEGSSYAVVKNTLTKRAADSVGFSDLGPLLNGPTAIAFIEGDPVTAAKAKTRKVVTEVDGPPVSDSELQTLKDWRKGRADGKPAYTVATDATLREVIRQQPRTPDDLLAIKGIGPSFVDKHAESLLELLAQ